MSIASSVHLAHLVLAKQHGTMLQQNMVGGVSTTRTLFYITHLHVLQLKKIKRDLNQHVHYGFNTCNGRSLKYLLPPLPLSMPTLASAKDWMEYSGAEAETEAEL